MEAKGHFLMRRVLVITLWAFLIQLLLQALPVTLGVASFPFILSPAIVLYAVFYLPPVEGALAVFLGGIMIDSLTGFPVGSNGFLLLIVWFATSMAIDALGKPTRLLLFGVGLCLSVVARVLWLIGLLMFNRGRANFLWTDFLWVPICDALISVAFAGLIDKCLIWFRLSEPEPMNLMSERG